MHPKYTLPRGVGTAAEAQAFLDANPDIESVQLVITDACGVGRGKNVAREELAALYGSGRNVAGSILGLDITGEDVEGTGLVWEVGDADQCCRPVAGSLARAPWLKRPTAQVLGTMYELDGRPSRADPRHVLAGVVARCEAAGLTPVVAVELEFYLLERDATGRLVPSAGMLSGERRGRIDAYGLGRLDDMAPLFDDLYAAARTLGLPVRTLMSEYAPGQFEITLEHRADALRAVDEAILFKRAVRGVAARHGRVACFMAKPFAERAGSGMHLHASLADRDGDNACAAEDPAGSPLLRHAIGGLRATLADGMAIYAPNANSYRRFRSHELRAGRRHLGHQQPLGEPARAGRTTGEPARRASRRRGRREPVPGRRAGARRHAARHRAPRSIRDRRWRATATRKRRRARCPRNGTPRSRRRSRRRSCATRSALDFLEVFLAIKRQEAEKFGALVTDRDYEWYLDTA